MKAFRLLTDSASKSFTSRPTLWACGLLFIFILALAYPALGGAFLVNPRSDQYIAGYAFREFAASSVREGHGVPLWNPYLFGGMPYLGAMHGDVFYPTALLRLLVPPDVGMTWGFILHVFFAGLFTFLYLRAERFAPLPAIAGGLAYMLGGNVAGLVSPGHDGKLFVASLLPLALLFARRASVDDRKWAWGALAATITLAALSPHPQALQYLLLVVGAYIAFRLYVNEDRKPAANRAGTLLFFLATAVLGLLGGAVAYTPLLEYTSWSPRSTGGGWEHAISYSMPPEETLNFYLPQFSGILEQYWGRNGIHFHSEYLGASVLVLAGLSFWGQHEGHRRLRWFWIAVAAVACVWALGGFTPAFRIIYMIVPGTKFFRAPSTILFVLSFSTAVLTALGVQRAVSERISVKYILGWLAIGALALATAATGTLTSLAIAIVGAERGALAENNLGALVVGAVRSLTFVALTSAVLFAPRKTKAATATFGWLILALIGADLWSIARHYWRFSSPAAELFKTDAAIEHLKSIAVPGRVVPLAVGPLNGRVPDPFFRYGDGRADGLMVHGVRSMVGYHGNEMQRYRELLGWDVDWPNRLANPNLWFLTNLQYLYTNAPTPPLPGMQMLVGPTRNAGGTDVYLYKFPGDNPPAYVAPIMIKAPDPDVLNTILDPRFDPKRAALFAPDANVTSASIPPELPSPSGAVVKLDEWDAGRIVASIDGNVGVGSALIVSENYFPGWRAFVDGSEAAVARANYTFIGVALPAGARRVELKYASSSFERGKTISIVAGTIILLLTGGAALNDRRLQFMKKHHTDPRVGEDQGVSP